MRKFLRWCLKVVVVMFVSSFLYALACKWIMPPVTITQITNIGYGFKRSYVSYDNISPNFKLAAIASEDQLFPDHNGFDWAAIEKSLNQPKKKSKKKSNRVAGAGASTISQQTAKNVFLWQGDGIMKYVRKIPEFYFTKLIELLWGKERILEVYLNVIEMGPGIYGAEAASKQYFNKSAESVSRDEAAKIIACLPNPKRFTIKPPSRWVAWKSQWIIRQMHQIEDDEDIQQLIR